MAEKKYLDSIIETRRKLESGKKLTPVKELKKVDEIINEKLKQMGIPLLPDKPQQNTAKGKDKKVRPRSEWTTQDYIDNEYFQDVL